MGLTLAPGGFLGSLQTTAHAAATFTVNSTGDGADSNTSDGVCNDGAGNCTLRAAIEQANATPGADTIAFQIPGPGVRTIAPTTALPAVNDLTVIDGYTQPGASTNSLAEGDNALLLVELSGAGAGSPGGLLINGLTVNAGHCVVRGLVINRFSGAGISLAVNGENTVEGNFIGTNSAGTGAAPNGNGVSINATSSPATANLVGGTSPAARNVISGNSGFGITVQGVARGTSVQGNFIGTNAAGTAKLGNGSHGIFITTVSNVVGGTTPGARNVISGNGQAGVMLQPSTSTVNTVQGNYIGTDASGAAELGNKFVGVWINSGAGQVVGGSEAPAGNVISGNDASGVLITGDLSRNNQVGGNLIGTDATGTRPLGNKLDGVRISEFAHDNFVQQQGPSGLPNTIAYNGVHGVAVYPPGAGNTIRRNNIFSNGALGIEINGDGISENDPGDADEGANNGQNYPLITSVTSGAGTTTIQGTLNSIPNTIFSIDFFANSGCDPNGFGEGARFFAGAGTTTDANGDAPFSFTFQQALPAGRVITATATRGAVPRDTSEFSPCSEAGAAGSVEFAAPAYNFIEDIGDAPVTLRRVGGSTGPLTVSFATTPGTATAGADYTPVTGTVTFADGETTKTFAVHVFDEGVVEPNETVGLVIFSATTPEAVGPRNRAVMNIVDGSVTPTVTFTSFVSAIGEELSGTSLAGYTVGLSAATGRTVSVHLQTSDGTATAGADYQPLSLDLVFAPGEVSKEVAVVINGDTLAEPPNETFFISLTNPVNATITNGQIQVAIIDNDTPALRFGAASYSAAEGAHAFEVTVLRSGADTGALTVDYATSDGTASERSDYTTALGTLRFAPGETSKSFTVLLTDDAFHEADETINLALSNPTGGAFLDVRGFVGAVVVGAGAATLTVVDNDAVTSPANPIDSSDFFVRQHYHDFLNREPDQSGFAFWQGEIESCGADAQCREVKRINVSAAFFLSIEFQRTGVLAYLTHKAAFGPTAPGSEAGVPILYRPFERDTQALQRGYVFGAPGAEAQLEANRRVFFDEFVTRPEFRSQYDALPNTNFVNALLANAGLAPTVGNLHISRLSAAQVVPPTNSAADGLIVLRRSPEGGSPDASISLSLNHLSSQVTGVHLHGPAGAGANAPALVTLPAGEFTDFRLTLTQQQVNYLINGQLYVDVHTQNYPDGEIRAQLSATLFRGDVLRAGLDSGILTRAQVLRVVAESEEFGRAEFRRAFVLMQYFGYLRRDPDAGGYAFWLGKLNDFNGDYIRAEMVKAFISSDEYRKRFGQ
ncbi:MAG TPA: Calx-beta domain-containing protein [Pyrinomonadaceae bacterium]